MATIALPRLTARNAVEARAQLRERKGLLLQAADDLLDRAALFAGEDIQRELMDDARDLLNQALAIKL